jgi:hypothetical protein
MLNSKKVLSWFFILVLGSTGGIVVYGAAQLAPIWQYTVIGTSVGIVLCVVLELSEIFWRRFNGEEWRITEVELEILGQKWKLANSGSQRRIAWLIFVELSTRISTQPMIDVAGDDGAALQSLYSIFQKTRTLISEIQPSRSMPEYEDGTDTIESFALAMLNQHLRPFLQKWHPEWEEWRRTEPAASCLSWDRHVKFRDDLRNLQAALREQSKGFARIAGVCHLERFLTEGES